MARSILYEDPLSPPILHIRQCIVWAERTCSVKYRKSLSNKEGTRASRVYKDNGMCHQATWELLVFARFWQAFICIHEDVNVPTTQQQYFRRVVKLPCLFQVSHFISKNVVIIRFVARELSKKKHREMPTSSKKRFPRRKRTTKSAGEAEREVADKWRQIGSRSWNVNLRTASHDGR